MLDKFRKNKRGGILTVIVGIMVAFVLLSFLLPVAYDQFFDVNTTLWDADVTSVWDVLPIIGIIVILLAMIGAAIRKKAG